MPDQPKSILYIRPDTIGDLVIFTSALIELQAAWPQARHTLLVRPGYECLAPLFPVSLHWQVAPINPFTEQPGASKEKLEAVLGELRDLAPDVIVAATLNRTWLEVAIASHFPAARRVVLGTAGVDPHFVQRLKLELGVEAATAFSEVVAIEERERDWENNHRLVDHLVGRSTPRSAPHIAVPGTAEEQARAFLQERGLTPGGFVAVFPGGLANVPIKAWPYSNFGELIRWLEEKDLPVLVLAHTSEAVAIEDVLAQVQTRGGKAPAVWLGRDGEIPLLAGLLGAAKLYVGHDTGAMHLAAAVGRPVVGIFGGGHWPRFRPVGPRTVSVVQPLPCFGCNWDCRFGDAPCVKTIDTADVIQGIERALAAGTEERNEVVEVQHFSPQSLRLIEEVTTRYGKLQADRMERQHRIEELKREADGKDAEISDLKKETNHKDEEIAALKISAEERKTEMEAIKAELEAECAEKDTEIVDLKAAANHKDAEIDELKAVCNEREALIITLDGHVKNFQKMVAELRGQSAEKDHQLAKHESAAQTYEKELETLRTTLAHLPPDAALWSQSLKDKDVHIGNIEAIVRSLRQEIAMLRHSVSNYEAGHSSLEQAKFYGRLLAEKEVVIQSLHRDCVQREAVIQQLALDAAGPLGRLNQLRFATRKHVELKYWIPFNDWLFKKVVEQYWMQIGELQHYAPRPLTWDQFPKAKLAESRLPKIGIVTPSYGQATFVESTMLSVLNQKYPKLYYAVQDGGSKDASPQIIARYASQLHRWESKPDKGQADAIVKGFAHLKDAIGPDDLMAWLNSDDLLAPRSLRYVAEYFAQNPLVDVVYGHRIIVDDHDREVGRWIMPRHDPKTLEWIDYVPQETLFWRKRIWDRAGGLDPSFQFALDWDLIARFQQAQAKIVRLPYFLGCFRIHPQQKTSQHIHTIGNEEMIRIRSRFHGERHSDFTTINRFARKARFGGALTARLAAMGVRY